MDDKQAYDVQPNRSVHKVAQNQLTLHDSSHESVPTHVHLDWQHQEGSIDAAPLLHRPQQWLTCLPLNLTKVRWHVASLDINLECVFSFL